MICQKSEDQPHQRGCELDFEAVPDSFFLESVLHRHLILFAPAYLSISSNQNEFRQAILVSFFKCLIHISSLDEIAWDKSGISGPILPTLFTFYGRFSHFQLDKKHSFPRQASVGKI